MPFDDDWLNLPGRPSSSVRTAARAPEARPNPSFAGSGTRKRSRNQSAVSGDSFFGNTVTKIVLLIALVWIGSRFADRLLIGNEVNNGSPDTALVNQSDEVASFDLESQIDHFVRNELQTLETN